jgi:Xaa-Pro aminopeptidase
MTDIGARFGNYVADGGRGFAYGSVSDRQRDIIETAAEVVEVGLRVARPGITANALNSAMQQVLVERGFAPYSGEAMGRGTGHGTGMDPEEELPWIGPGNTTVLQEDMVFTLKATINVPDAGGLRTERIVRLTSDGVETLDKFPMRNYW